MKKFKVEALLAAALLLLFVLFLQWHSPGQALNQFEVDRYMASLAQDLPWPEAEKVEILHHLRSWAEADDGRPVYMLNLMRYYPTLRDVPGVKGFDGSPAQANAYYEEHVMPLLFEVGGYPIFASRMQGVLGGESPSTNLITFEPALDNWDSVLVVRYPSRRAFMDLISNPEYLRYAPFKAASVLVGLVPMTGDLILPLLNWAFAALLVLVFFLVAWLRALRCH